MKLRLAALAAAAILIIGCGPASARTSRAHRPAPRAARSARARTVARPVTLAPPATATANPAYNGAACTTCATPADAVGYRIHTGPGRPNDGYCLRTAPTEAAQGVAAGVLERDSLCDPLGVVR